MSANDQLTPREWEVLALVAEGWRNAQIAQKLYISEATVETHLHRIFSKLGVATRAAAAVYARPVAMAQPKIQETLDDRRQTGRYTGARTSFRQEALIVKDIR